VTTSINIHLTHRSRCQFRNHSLGNGTYSVSICSATSNYDKQYTGSQWTSTELTIMTNKDGLSSLDELIRLLQKTRQHIGVCDHCENGTVYNAIETQDGERREANPCPKCKGTGQL